MDNAGTDRILFGSDYPVIEEYLISAAAKTIDESGIRGKESILSENVRILLGL